MNENPKLTIRISVEGEIYPVAYEIDAGVEAFISFLKFFRDCREVSSRYKPVVLPHNNGHQRIRTEDILYLESDGSYCTIYFCSGKSIFVAVAMGTLTDDLCEQGIVRCHKRYAVNIHAVDYVGGNYLVLRDGKQLDMGGTFKDKIVSCFNYRGTRSLKYR
ncbi:MAG: LytTR family transcriptional regulator [Dysgonamonadaceae bacterium]|jgi:hypothetical protein|nr:LytTR family transcriptional regulator [Dysgonamonadaceae bacterium]